MSRKIIVVLAIFLLTAVSFAHAQKQAAIPRIGILRAGSPGDVNLELFLQGLRDLGYVDGKNIFIEVRYAQGDQKRSAELAKELVQLNVDAVFTSGTRAIRVRRSTARATSGSRSKRRKPSRLSWSAPAIRSLRV